MGAEPSDDWISVSDLAEYAYCPRAHYFRHHPPPGGRDPESDRSTRRGAEYHRRMLGGVRRRDASIVRNSIALLLALLGLAVLVISWSAGWI